MQPATNTNARDDLAARFGLSGQLSFTEGPGGLTIARIHNQYASADIALNGAHVLSYQPHGESPVLWLSKTARFETGKAIRGGIPLCWPWFAAHPNDSGKPAHGFARTAVWQMQYVEATADNATRLVLSLSESPQTLTLWPYAFTFTAIITVGRQLEVELITHNRSDQDMLCSGALHSYFDIADAESSLITGLENTRYIDKLSDMHIKEQDSPLMIDQAMDRIYFDTVIDCIIHDTARQRRIYVSKQGSHTTVIWNPGAQGAASMNDFDDNGYLNMVCVETANADPDTVIIKPDKSHSLQTSIRVQTLP